MRPRDRVGALLLVLVVGFGTARGAETTASAAHTENATFAGGCFWSMQLAFDGLPGVVATTAGYAGGTTKDPSYQDVESGGTGHAEAVQVEYDPNKTTYEALLDVYWHDIDPTDSEGQFCDRGPQYRSVIFYANDGQKRLAEKSKVEVAKDLRVPGPIVTEIRPASAFYRAEEYHQSFYRKNPIRYRWYRQGCGRDGRVAEVWGRAPTH
jgi:peptide-methionine (S)-S-oxide reductase